MFFGSSTQTSNRARAAPTPRREAPAPWLARCPRRLVVEPRDSCQQPDLQSSAAGSSSALPKPTGCPREETRQEARPAQASPRASAEAVAEAVAEAAAEAASAAAEKLPGSSGVLPAKPE